MSFSAGTARCPCCCQAHRCQRPSWQQVSRPLAPHIYDVAAAGVERGGRRGVLPRRRRRRRRSGCNEAVVVLLVCHQVPDVKHALPGNAAGHTGVSQRACSPKCAMQAQGRRLLPCTCAICELGHPTSTAVPAESGQQSRAPAAFQLALTVCVLPVPGGPWMSTKGSSGCLAAPSSARSAGAPRWQAAICARCQARKQGGEGRGRAAPVQRGACQVWLPIACPDRCIHTQVR